MIFARKYAAEIIGVVLGMLFLGWLVWLVAIRPGQMAEEAARAKAGSTIAQGEVAKAQDAARIVEKHFTEKERIERVTIQGTAGIMAAQGAEVRVPADVDRAARAALCLQDAYRGSDACQQLPRPDSGNGEGPNAGRPAAR
jgi:hypothetical protein